MQLKVWFPSKRFPTDSTSMRFICSMNLLMNKSVLTSLCRPANIQYIEFLSSKNFLVWKNSRSFGESFSTFGMYIVFLLCGLTDILGIAASMLVLLFCPKYLWSLLVLSYGRPFSLIEWHALYIFFFCFISEFIKVELDCFSVT